MQWPFASRRTTGQQQRRSWLSEAICGKVEHEGHVTRRFASVRSVAGQPHALLRAALLDQDWREGDAVTAISDGDPCCRRWCARRQAAQWSTSWTGSTFPCACSTSSRSWEACVPWGCRPLPRSTVFGSTLKPRRLRHLLWNDHHEKACEALGKIASWAKDVIVLNIPVIKAKARRLIARCAELHGYIESNEGALIDYGQRHRAGKPISTSRAEGTVNQRVSARMNKRRQMRWSHRGAHRVLQVRAAVLDGRFGHPAIQLAA